MPYKDYLVKEYLNPILSTLISISNYIYEVANLAKYQDVFFSIFFWTVGGIIFAIILLTLLKWRSNKLDKAEYYTNMASVYYDEGLYAKSLEYINNGMAIRKKILREWSITILLDYCFIAKIYATTYDFKKSWHYYALAIEHAERNIMFFKAKADLYRSISFYLKKQNLHYKRLDYLKKALLFYKRSFSKLKPHKSVLYAELSDCYRDLNDYKKSIDFYKKSLACSSGLKKDEKHYVATIYYGMGETYAAMHQHNEALHYHEEALSLLYNTFGEDHLDIAESYDAIGIIFFKKKHYSKAKLFFNKAIKVRNRILSPNDIAFSKTFTVFAKLLIEEGKDLNLALSYLERSSEIYADDIKKNKDLIFENTFLIGKVFSLQKKYNSAIHAYESLLDIFQNPIEETQGCKF